MYGSVVSAGYSGALIYGGSTNNTSYIAGGGTGTGSILNFYKGTIASFPAFTSTTTRTSDLLISMSMPAGATSWIQVSSSNSVRVQLGVSNVPGGTATASGLATWFLMQNYFSGGTLTDLTIRSALIGTIGTIGSGADMEIYDNNIVSGNSYKSYGFYMNFPYDMTF